VPARTTPQDRPPRDPLTQRRVSGSITTVAAALASLLNLI
jgi:hypothetical protein